MTQEQTVIETSNGRRYIVDLEAIALRSEENPEKMVQFKTRESLIGYVKRFAKKEDRVKWKQTEAGLQGLLLSVQRTAAHLGTIKSDIPAAEQIKGTMFAPEAPAVEPSAVQLSLL